MSLSCRDHTLIEQQQIQLFNTDLDDTLCTDVTLQRLTTLNDEVMYARAYEQRSTTLALPAASVPRSAPR
jgi:hypothetical protein